MAVDAAMVERVAKLARLRLEPGQAAHLETEINGILGWIEQLQQVDTDGVAPMTAVIPNALRLREDIVNDGGIRDDVLVNAPQAEHGFFAVPKVIE